MIDPWGTPDEIGSDEAARPSILCFHVTSSFSKTENYESFCSSSFIRCKTL